MPEQAYGSKPLVSIGGKRLTTPYDDRISTVVVDQDLTSPAFCQVVVADPDRDFLSSNSVEVGKTLEAAASAVADEETNPLFSGVLQSIDVIFDEEAGGQSVALVAFDEAYALTQARISRSFNDVTVGDVISSLCQDLGIPVGSVDTESVVLDHVGLFDETPWDFITRNASYSGCIVAAVDGKVQVTRPTEASGGPSPGDFGAKDPTQLVPGHNVTSLRLHQTTARQVGEVEVRGWDVANKASLAASAPATTVAAASESKPEDVGRKLGSDRIIDPRPHLDQQALCDHQAAAAGAGLASQHLAAEGEAIGNPTLRAGAVVSIGAVDQLSGKYLLTQCRHRFEDEGYATDFRCSGLHNRSLIGLLEVAQPRHLGGVYPGVVTNNDDPDKLGRVRVSFPWLSDDYESAWARVGQVGAGAERGIHWFPEVDDEVAIAFIGGRPEAPVVLGGLFNGVDQPPFADFVDGSGKVNRRGFKTRSGHIIELVDDPGSEAIELTSVGELTIKAKSMSIVAEGDASLEAGGTLSLKGSTINLN